MMMLVVECNQKKSKRVRRLPPFELTLATYRCNCKIKKKKKKTKMAPKKKSSLV